MATSESVRGRRTRRRTTQQPCDRSSGRVKMYLAENEFCILRVLPQERLNIPGRLPPKINRWLCCLFSVQQSNELIGGIFNSSRCPCLDSAIRCYSLLASLGSFGELARLWGGVRRWMYLLWKTTYSGLTLRWSKGEGAASVHARVR